MKKTENTRKGVRNAQQTTTAKPVELPDSFLFKRGESGVKVMTGRARALLIKSIKTLDENDKALAQMVLVADALNRASEILGDARKGSGTKLAEKVLTPLVETLVRQRKEICRDALSTAP